MSEICQNSNKCNIKCEWASTDRIITNPDGQVVPCCFFANLLYISKQLGYPEKLPNIKREEFELEYQIAFTPLIVQETMEDPILRDYIEHEEELNLFTNDLKDIINNDWFKRLEESWDDPEKVSSICVKHCQQK